MVHENAEEHYPQEWKDDIKKGKKIKQSKKDKFDNENSPYKSRDAITVTELMDAINTGWILILHIQIA